jgi:Tol biopolymer transport system component/tRNA A-37 threonylcarbamoyl transferase component Bud32
MHVKRVSPVFEDLSTTTIRRFEVTRLIARGGMGEVYLARDAVLGRDLALKILRPDLTRKPDRLERFIQEARAASALNHPHLIAIYDIGESTPKREGVAVGPPVLYIAMELVSGETLRAVIQSGGRELDRMLEHLAQVADALAAAHAAGVTHRDLKPENLMIAAGGYAKVLDFGVAKLRTDLFRKEEGSPDTADNRGVVIGTVGYMSPEQAQGRAVDHRTDIFSFGCVLYEAITGRRAFDGPTSFAILRRICDEHPAPIAAFTPDAPPALQAIVSKCLAKAPADRYQSMSDLAGDLRRARLAIDPRTLAAFARRRSARRGSIIAAAIGLVAFALAIGWGVMRGSQTAPPRMSIERLTASGTAIDSALSPDGRYLAWVDSVGGRQGLKVRQLSEDRHVELVPLAPVGFWGIAFAPNGTRIYYTIKSAQEPTGRLFTIDVLGGTPQPVLEGIDSTVTFSPDGRRLAFYRANHPERGATALITASIDGGDIRVISSTRSPEFFVPAFFAAPSWSPDGARIAAAVHHASTGDAVLATFDATTGTRESFEQRFEDVTFTAWLRDGAGILFVANQSDGLREFPRKIWLQPFPRGEPHRVTPDLLEYRNISLRSDGAAFASIGLDASYTLWRVPLAGGDFQRIASERYDGLLGVAPVSDGRIVITTGERGNAQLAVVDRTGSGRQMLTREGVNMWPAAAPDGQTIAFASNRDGQTGIWAMATDGGSPRLLTHVAQPTWLSVTPDGRSVVFALLRQAETSTWRVPIEGGEPTLLASGLDRPAISPDGRLLAGIHTAGDGQQALVVVPIDSSSPAQSFGRIAPATANGLMEWTADSQGILYSTVERANVWLQRIDGRPATKITSLTDLAIVRGKRTPDGRSLILARGVAQTDAYLVSRFK